MVDALTSNQTLEWYAVKFDQGLVRAESDPISSDAQSGLIEALQGTIAYFVLFWGSLPGGLFRCFGFFF